MENKIVPENKIKRKKFFASLSIGMLGITVLNQFPFSLFKSKTASAGKVKVQINPLAVNRKKIGEKNA
ncbi:MAG: hypothetical protein R6W90_09565 [Ignavibacteriaceae bacterium]